MTDNLSNNHQKTLGLGCSTFGGSNSKKAALRALHDAFELGVNYFDIARSYGYGQAESIVGEFISDKRDQVIITSKFGIAPPPAFPLMSQVKNTVRFMKKMAPGVVQQLIEAYSHNQVNRPVITPRLAIDTLEKSLKELKTDYLDYYLLHDCSFEDASSNDVGAALDKAKEKGMIRQWGATCETPAELHLYFQKNSPFNLVQFPYQPGSSWVKGKTDTGISKALFSIMSQSGKYKNPPASFFRELPINRRIPGLVNNIQEAWLYIACQELDQGIILCSMTQRKHIERNLAIIEAPGISAAELNEMKGKAMTRIAPSRVVTQGQLQASPAG